MSRYKELIVWQKAVELARAVYILTNDFSKEELYGLTSQMRRCAVSIPSNIAEGSKRNTQILEITKMLTTMITKD